jgi:3-hydroxyisobutyrate dehydrogenase-like beta-hydroxyacid dehydrogenase
MTDNIRLAGLRGPVQLGRTRLGKAIRLNLIRTGFGVARGVRSISSSSIRRVGFIGLGRMGFPMAHNLLKAGFDLSVYNRTTAKAQPLVDLGASLAISPKEAARGADVVITSLMDDQSVLDMVTGEEGLLAGLQVGGIHIGTSTSSPRLGAHLAELHRAQGKVYLAAPVVGRGDAAKARNLTTFVAGDPLAIRKCRAIFDAYSLIVLNAGADPAAANMLKLIANYSAMSVIDIVGQLFALGEKAGVDPGTITLVLKTTFDNPHFHYYIDKIRSRDFDQVGFDVRGGLKDAQLMMQVSEDTQVGLTNAENASKKYLAALANGLEDKDWSAIYEITRQNAGLK